MMRRRDFVTGATGLAAYAQIWAKAGALTPDRWAGLNATAPAAAIW
jgi:hypothetical protein